MCINGTIVCTEIAYFMVDASMTVAPERVLTKGLLFYNMLCSGFSQIVVGFDRVSLLWRPAHYCGGYFDN